MSFEIELLQNVTDEIVAALNVLLSLLSNSAPPLDAEALAGVISQPGSNLLIARTNGQIVGMLTLVTFEIPTGLRAWIEDVVVNDSVRGKGIGTALTREAIRLARERGARTVDLTSRPSRQAAHRLYEGLGFKIRDSRVYRLADNDGANQGNPP
jgi:ribosomal protein S18 acetylase RimI-like enzyme